MGLADLGEADRAFLVQHKGGRVSRFVRGIPAQAPLVGELVVGVEQQAKVLGQGFARNEVGGVLLEALSRAGVNKQDRGLLALELRSASEQVADLRSTGRSLIAGIAAQNYENDRPAPQGRGEAELAAAVGLEREVLGGLADSGYLGACRGGKDEREKNGGGNAQQRWGGSSEGVHSGFLPGQMRDAADSAIVAHKGGQNGHSGVEPPTFGWRRSAGTSAPVGAGAFPARQGKRPGPSGCQEGSQACSHSINRRRLTTHERFFFADEPASPP